MIRNSMHNSNILSSRKDSLNTDLSPTMLKPRKSMFGLQSLQTTRANSFVN